MEKETQAVDTSINEVEQTTQQTQVEETPKVDQPQAQEPESKVGEKDKVFTQAQLDEIVINRLGKERARFLKKLGVDDETKLDEIVKKAQDYEVVRSEVETLKLQKERQEKVNVLTTLNADPEFTDYLLEKIEVGEGETYEVVAKKYLEDHPKFVVEQFNKVDSSITMSGQSYPNFENMTTEQYLAWRAKNKL